jgi:dihydroorotate dehydrogenase
MRAFTYRVDASYDWNYEHGPSYDGAPPAVPPTPLKRFLGLELSSRLGIAAGLLLNSKWVRLYARLGFDILTYKTVRIRYRACHPMPNWIFLERERPLDAAAEGELLVRREAPAAPGSAADIERITSAVSFGMPSKDPEVWMADVAEARRALGPTQALVVSVVASPSPGAPPPALVGEFARLAALARDAGAQVIEANLSCPNVTTPEGQVYQDAELSGQVARAMRQAAGAAPILLKAGYFREKAALDAFLRAVAGAASGVTLVNGISRRLVNRDGTPAFGPGREVAGVLGRAIHEPCLENVRAAAATIARERLDLAIAAVGGVLSEADAARYFEAGAGAVLLGGAPMLDPHLALRFKQAHPEW